MIDYSGCSGVPGRFSFDASDMTSVIMVRGNHAGNRLNGRA